MSGNDPACPGCIGRSKPNSGAGRHKNAEPPYRMPPGGRFTAGSADKGPSSARSICDMRASVGRPASIDRGVPNRLRANRDRGTSCGQHHVQRKPQRTNGEPEPCCPTPLQNLAAVGIAPSAAEHCGFAVPADGDQIGAQRDGRERQGGGRPGNCTRRYSHFFIAANPACVSEYPPLNRSLTSIESAVNC